MEYICTPKKEIEDRIKKLQNELKKNEIDAAVIIQRADLFYFSGTSQSSHLIVPKEGEPVLAVKKNFKRAEKESSVKNIVPLKSLKELLSYIPIESKKGKIGMEFDVLPVNLFFKYKKLFSDFEITDISAFIKSIRMIKSKYELWLLEETAKMNNSVFSLMSGILKEGISELEAVSAIEAEFRRIGHQGITHVRGFNMELFYGQLMSGENGGVPSFFDGPSGGMGLNPSYPQGAGFKIIKRNEPIIADFATAKNGYIVDQTRIFSIGKIADEFIKAHETAIDIKYEMMRLGVSGSDGKDLFAAAWDIADKKGFGDYFIGFAENKVSFVGHGVGIELDELPIIAKNFSIILKPNMVFALEPKFIFPGKGIVGIEDTFYVTDKGLKQISFFDDAIQVL